MTLSAGVPIRCAVILGGRWGLVDKPPSLAYTLRASFRPNNWPHSDEVCVAVEWQGAMICDHTLKLDPRPVVEVTAPEVASTGDVIPIARVRSGSLSLAALAVSEADVERRRLGRWRVRPTLQRELPTELQGVTTGQQTGTLDRP